MNTTVTLNRTQLNALWSKACELLRDANTIQEGMHVKDEYAAALMVKQELRAEATHVMEMDDSHICAIYDLNGQPYCVDCFDTDVCNEDDTIYHLIINNVDTVIDHPMVGEIITDTTVQFEQVAGEIIPLEGIYCCKCDSELYAPYETDDIETCESDTDVSDTHIKNED